MNWFFHKLYWTGWISLHNQRKRELLSEEGKERSELRVLSGMALLGFTSFYREGFEVVLFLQSYRLKLGSLVVLYGVVVGAFATAIVAILTFVAHRHLPYRRMLVSTGSDARLCAARDGGRGGAGDAARPMVTSDRHSEARARDSFLDGSLVLNFSKRRDSNRSGSCCDSRFWLLPHGAFIARNCTLAMPPPKTRDASFRYSGKSRPDQHQI